MLYRIVEISTEKSTGLTYLLVHFWLDEASHDKGDEPVLVNDFLMALADEAERIVEDANGWRAVNGVFELPYEEIDGEWVEKRKEWDRETVKVDVPAIIKANIERYWTTAETKQWRGDHTADMTKPFYEGEKRIQQRAVAVFERDASDPTGVIARADVAAIKDQPIVKAATVRGGR